MYDADIDAILMKNPATRLCFGGVYACDDLPLLATKPGYVINLDKKSESGSHWVCVYFNFVERHAYYFDSLGDKPTNAYIVRFIKRNSKTCEWNTIPVQHLCANTCGQWTIFFLDRRCRGERDVLTRIIEKKIDDEKVVKYVARKFSYTRNVHYDKTCMMSSKAILSSLLVPD